MIKTKTFVVKTTGSFSDTNDAAEQLDDMIKEFIEEKSTDPSFKVINIQYRPTISPVGDRLDHWYPSAMLVYDEA